MLDQQGLGYLTEEDLLKHLSSDGRGEPFTLEEFEEMMSAARDPDKGVVVYSDHATIMVPDREG